MCVWEFVFSLIRCTFHFSNHLAEKERADSLTVIFLHVFCVLLVYMCSSLFLFILSGVLKLPGFEVII